jgi:hypothetical protein
MSALWRLLALAWLAGSVMPLQARDPQKTDAPAAVAKSPQFVLAWGKKGHGPGEFYSPISIAINKKDEVFVTDLNNARVQKFTTDGKYLGGFDLPLDAPKRKSCSIGGMAVDDTGLLYLAFMNQHKLGVYTESGRLVRQRQPHGPVPELRST